MFGFGHSGGNAYGDGCRQEHPATKLTSVVCRESKSRAAGGPACCDVGGPRPMRWAGAGCVGFRDGLVAVVHPGACRDVVFSECGEQPAKGGGYLL